VSSVTEALDAPLTEPTVVLNLLFVIINIVMFITVNNSYNLSYLEYYVMFFVKEANIGFNINTRHPDVYWLTNKGTYSLTHQYINTFYNTYRLHVSAYYSHLRAYVIRALNTIEYLIVLSALINICSYKYLHGSMNINVKIFDVKGYQSMIFLYFQLR
jgi:hypothetical protein